MSRTRRDFDSQNLHERADKIPHLTHRAMGGWVQKISMMTTMRTVATGTEMKAKSDATNSTERNRLTQTLTQTLTSTFQHSTQ